MPPDEEGQERAGSNEVAGGERTDSPASLPAVEPPVPSGTSASPVLVKEAIPPADPTGAGWVRTATLASVVVVVVVWAVLQLWGLGRTPFHTRGEAREAVVVWEIMHGGSWILPLRGGVEIPSKPPLFHWLGAVASAAYGDMGEGSVRLPSALCSLAAALLVTVAGASLLGVRPGLLAGLMLLTSFEWERSATSARVDMTLTFGLTLVLVGILLLRRRRRLLWLALVYGGMLWAVLAKGPLAGLILPLVEIAAFCVVDRNLELVRRLHLARGLGVVLIGMLAWYGLAWQEGGRAFLQRQVLFENLGRVVGGAGYRGGHLHSPAYLVGTLVTGLLPWSLFLPALAVWLPRWRRQGERASVIRLLSTWCVVLFCVYAVAASKRSVYLLGLYPALCLLLGAWWDDVLGRRVGPAWGVRTLAVIGWSAALALALALLGLVAERAGVPVLRTLVGDGVGEASAPALVVATVASRAALVAGSALALGAAGAVLLALAATRRRWGGVFFGLCLAAGAVIVCVQQAFLPAVAEQKTRARFAAVVRRIVPASGDLAFYRRVDPGMILYWNRRIPVLGRSLWEKGPPFVLIKAGAWARLDSTERRWYELVPGGGSGSAGHMGRLLLLRRVRRE